MTTIPAHRAGRMPSVPTLSASNAALLIDFDNVTLGVRSDLTKELRHLLDSDIIKGKVSVQRAYADWRRYPQYIVPLSESSIDLIFAPAFGTNKKNATDIRLAIDATERVIAEVATWNVASLHVLREHAFTDVGELLAPDPKAPVCALAFKVVHDTHRGSVVFARVYSGTLRARDTLLNSSTDEKERPSQLLSIQADVSSSSHPCASPSLPVRAAAQAAQKHACRCGTRSNR